MRSLIGSLINRAPVAYVGRRPAGALWGNPPPTQLQSMAAMGGTGTLFAVASRISQDVAASEWCLYRKSTDARRSYSTSPKPRQEILRHPALEVWNQPNPFMNRQQFLEIVAQHQELVGEQYWLPAKSESFGVDIPVELWPARPDRMVEIPSATDYLAGWIYRDPDGPRVPLSTSEVIQLKAPNPLNIYRGMGAVQTILTTLDATRYGAEWGRNFFINGAQPGGIIEMPGNMTDPDFDTFKARWDENHKGVAAAHKVALLENGMKWIDVNFSQKDMQFVELQDASREVIREAFGISKTMLGMTEDVNRATADAARAVYAENLLVPRLDRIRGALNGQFLPLFGALGEGLEFDYVSPVPADLDREASERTSKTDAVTKMIAAGFEPAAVLESYGLSPLPFVGKGQDAGSAPQGFEAAARA